MPSRTVNILVYVDQPLAVALAAKLVGILTTHTDGQHSRAGINWLISAGVETTQTGSYQNDVREMLPEDLIYYLFPKISERYESVSTSLDKLATTSSESLVPGDVISICGSLNFPHMNEDINFSPLENIELDLPSVSFHGERCIVAQLSDSQYKIPVYFPDISKYQVIFCQNQPVEVTGIVRWVPPYSPSGARALNIAIRVAALWLR